MAGAFDAAKVGKDITAPIAATVVALATMPKVVKEFGAALIESKRHLGEMNAAYGVASARLDIQRFNRNVRLGNATSGSFTALTRTQNRLEEKLLPYAITGANALLRIAVLAEKVAIATVTVAEMAAKISGWAPILQAVGRWVNWGNNGGPGQVQPLANLAGALGRGNFAMRQRPPMGPMGAQAPQLRPQQNQGGN